MSDSVSKQASSEKDQRNCFRRFIYLEGSMQKALTWSE